MSNKVEEALVALVALAKDAEFADGLKADMRYFGAVGDFKAADVYFYTYLEVDAGIDDAVAALKEV
jgi:hypothetical protein